jgi:hypothetical protein
METVILPSVSYNCEVWFLTFEEAHLLHKLWRTSHFIVLKGMGLAYRIYKKYRSILDGILHGSWAVEVPVVLDYSLLCYNTIMVGGFHCSMQTHCLKSHTEKEFLGNTQRCICKRRRVECYKNREMTWDYPIFLCASSKECSYSVHSQRRGLS